MDSKKNLFTLNDSEKNDENKPNTINTLVPSFFSLNQFLSFIPTPEEELEEIEKDDKILQERITEAEESLQKIETRMKTHPEETEELQEKWNFINSLLESFEYDLKYNKVHKKSLTNLYYENDDDIANQEFSNQLPELFATTFISTKKKMEDVNQIVNKLKKDSIKAIEECIYCNQILKDEKGRKISKQHFHLNKENFIYYHPVICIDCLETLYPENSIVFKEEDHEDCCKKGSKIYSNQLNIDNPIIDGYITKLKIKEKEKNKEMIMMKPEKNSLDL
jgi:hypothetical protein